jgi:hypothetical protein
MNEYEKLVNKIRSNKWKIKLGLESETLNDIPNSTNQTLYNIYNNNNNINCLRTETAEMPHKIRNSCYTLRLKSINNSYYQDCGSKLCGKSNERMKLKSKIVFMWPTTTKESCYTFVMRTDKIILKYLLLLLLKKQVNNVIIMLSYQ